ncbi:MAG: hypothetical protein BGP06_21310 [Rhizobiales bacterium 65-9]|nr:hypothetical protein [Hyphomicrobiales bacterium]OJY36547.1 MAG: hypothetical protein BGP06_21310 [Rhizobiales bacterium 65-9]
MARNQFEQVDAPVDDAMTLVLAKSATGDVAEIVCPAAAAAGRLPKDYASGPLAVKDALRGAIKLANDLKVPLVVADPDGLWLKEWGELHRVADEEGPSAA